MKAPQITHLQFATLCAVGATERSGAEVRNALAKLGHKRSLPSFYDLMARMEEGELVKGWYEQIEVDGYKVRERRYRLLGKGVDARNAFVKWTETASSTVTGVPAS